MNDECLICGSPLEYLDTGISMECALCHKTEISKTHCINGHYVCSECHTQGMDSIITLCLNETSKNPAEIADRIMSQPFCHMHGPEHHVIVGSALLTAYKNAGGELDLKNALIEMLSRGKCVPGGTCGFWGACGAAISTGIYFAIISGSTPLKNEPWGHSNIMTSRSLAQIGAIGGPRCCKRDSYIAITEAVKFTKEQYGVEMDLAEIVCTYSQKNNQCIKERCPFSPLNHTAN